MENIVLGGYHGANESNQCQQPCGGAVCAAFLRGFWPGKDRKSAGPVPLRGHMGGIAISTLHWNHLNPKLQSRLTVRPTTTLARCPKTNTLTTS